MTDAHVDTLIGSPVTLRRLGRDEGPYAGVLCGGQPPRVLVDEDALPDVMWRADPGGHLLAPRDAVRTQGGVSALLPHCRGRLRGSDGHSTGAVVTIAVSMIRAANEAGGLGEERGSWWVDLDGRPVLALGVDGPWRDEGVVVLENLAAAASGALARTIADIAGDFHTPALVRRHADAWDDALFATAEAVALAEHEPAAPADSALLPLRAAAVRREPSVADAQTWVTRLVDADLGRRAGEALAAARATVAGALARATWGRRTPASAAPAPSAASRRRRGPLLAAVALAAVVVTAGVLWPSGETSTGMPVAETPEASDDAVAPTAAAAVPAATPGASPVERGAARAISLLRECIAGAPEVCARVREDPSRSLPDGLVANATTVSRVELIDEYGGVIVVRADADGFPSQAVVLIQQEEEWLVRDVYNLADQP